MGPSTWAKGERAEREAVGSRVQGQRDLQVVTKPTAPLIRRWPRERGAL